MLHRGIVGGGGEGREWRGAAGRGSVGIRKEGSVSPTGGPGEDMGRRHAPSARVHSAASLAQT